MEGGIPTSSRLKLPFSWAAAIVICLALPVLCESAVLSVDTVWSGQVNVSEDILVPEGITLTVSAGTTVRIAAAEGTKVDPEYLSALTEILIRGSLKVEGTAAEPVRFMRSGEGAWAGIEIDGGNAVINGCEIRDAETALSFFEGKGEVTETSIRNNRYGIVAYGRTSQILVRSGQVADNDYGTLALFGAEIKIPEGLVVRNRKYDRKTAPLRSTGLQRPPAIPIPEITAEYRDDVLPGDTVWRGRVEISGLIRIPEGSRLIILPGTVVEFTKKDSNADGIGENGLMIQGLLIAKGTAAAPISFRSGERVRRMGDWDSINIMNSESARNLVEYCMIEDAYRGLHFHFSNVNVRHSVFTNNYRAVQFQESTAELLGNKFIGNKSGVQARDSDILLAGNEFSGNYSGAVFFRNRLQGSENAFIGNLREGLRIREGVPVLSGNLLDGNRFGLMVSDLVYGSIAQNVIARNAESGVSVKNCANLEISGNYIGENFQSGIHAQLSSVWIRNNLIAGNGERGIGVLSFNGSVRDNNFGRSGRCAVEVEGPGDLEARANWWGVREPSSVVCDKSIDPSRGKADIGEFRTRPVRFQWPGSRVVTDSLWYGEILVNGTLDIEPGVTLEVAPGTTVAFARDAGMRVRGRLLAAGTPDSRIAFTSAARPVASEWGEVLLEYAQGSRLAYADFAYGTWAVHSHFTDLAISDCTFSQNYGGVRFRSGPIGIHASSFRDNEIGIRAYRGNAGVTRNLFSQNGTAIFVREKASDLKIFENDFAGNRVYDIRLGDFNDENLAAGRNWWAREPLLFDDRTEPGIGRVDIKPSAKGPWYGRKDTEPQ